MEKTMTDQTTEREKLLPCPFCGCDDILPCLDDETGLWECGCDSCDIHARAGLEEWAITKWNARHPAPVSISTLREAFEKWYIKNVFDLEETPLGSRTCNLQWLAWQACASTHAADVERCNPRPVSLEKCIEAMHKVTHPDGDGHPAFHSSRDVAKAVLDAAKVQYE
jgi:hypothetical protein